MLKKLKNLLKTKTCFAITSWRRVLKETPFCQSLRHEVIGFDFITF